MRIILAGGGTGGHLYPGLAIAREFQKQKPGARILFVITRRKIDQHIISQEGWPYVELPVESFRGISRRTLWALGSLIWSIRLAIRLVRSHCPRLIIGLGAYPSVPTLVAGKLCGVPLVIQEQNLFPGGANKLLARWAERVFISFSETERFLPRIPKERIILCGNPVRHGLCTDFKGLKAGFRSHFGLDDDIFTLLIFGGSKGAHPINKAMMEGLADLTEERAKRLQIIHQTGQEDFKEVKNFYHRISAKAVVLPYIHEMVDAYKAADLVICRAGATTLAEITALGKPSILVPYPYAVRDHQMINAKALQRVGAAELIPDRELTGNTLWSKIDRLMDHPEKLFCMQEEAKKLGKPKAACKIVQKSLCLIEKYKEKTVLRKGGKGPCF
jgi:UDP-N-acetylglucosamine--N-acetylmuramyl-(pentapeptide) pyrophosphoryl-undecaprenol N-acetylglucosamine transferase